MSAVMRVVVVAGVLLALAFIYVPLGWAALRWAFVTITSFWGLA